MFIIAESGATKTDWQICNDKECLFNIQSEGISPNFMSQSHIAEVVKNAASKISEKVSISELKQIYYYGTGCGYVSTDAIIEQALKQEFTKSNVEIKNDVLASARALCQNQPGFACILGTGSNSCFFDGQNILENRFSPGYVLGDYGSGAHLGITLLRAFLEGDLPSDVLAIFNKELGHSYEHIIENVYRKPAPSKYLAIYAKFLNQNKENPYLLSIVHFSFNEFVTRILIKYGQARVLPFHFVGSIAYHFKNELKTVLEKNNLKMGIVLQTPSEGLLKFHLSK